MFTPDDQQALDDSTGGKLDEASFLPVYARNWSYEWQLYRDLFIFAQDNRIPLIALNIPKAIMAKVMAESPSALKESEVAPKISWSLSAEMRRVYEAPYRRLHGNHGLE